MVITLLDFELIRTAYMRKYWKVIVLSDAIDD